LDAIAINNLGKTGLFEAFSKITGWEYPYEYLMGCIKHFSGIIVPKPGFKELTDSR